MWSSGYYDKLEHESLFNEEYENKREASPTESYEFFASSDPVCGIDIEYFWTLCVLLYTVHQKGYTHKKIS